MFNPLFNQSVRIPDDGVIAKTLIENIEAMANQSNVADYAAQILSERNYRNTAVDEIIELPKELLNVIANNPNQVPTEQRFADCLADFSLIAAVHTVQRDRAFLQEAQRLEPHVFKEVSGIIASVNATLNQYGAGEPAPQNIGGYTPRNNRSTATPVTTTVGRAGRSAPKGAADAPPQAPTSYEPKTETKLPTTRPLLRRKRKAMEDKILAYSDHATFNRLPMRTHDIKPQADFYGFLKDPLNTLDTSYIHSLVTDLIGTSHAQVVAAGWCATMASTSANVHNTVLDIAYENLGTVYMAESNEARETELLEIGEFADLIAGTGRIKTLDSLHQQLTALGSLVETSVLAASLFRDINRRVTIAVNQMIRYDLALEKLDIDDFSADWVELVSYLNGKYPPTTVRSELEKWGNPIVSRVLQFHIPTEAYGPYIEEVATRCIFSLEPNFVCVLPVSAGTLGIQFEQRTSFVCPKETPTEYEYLSAILERAEAEQPLTTYNSVSISTIDNVRFNLRKTDIKLDNAKVATTKYLAVTFIDYQ